MEARIKKEAETELKGGPEEGFFQKNERDFTNCSNFLKVLFKFSGYDTDILQEGSLRQRGQKTVGGAV